MEKIMTITCFSSLYIQKDGENLFGNESSTIPLFQETSSKVVAMNPHKRKIFLHLNCNQPKNTYSMC